MAIQNNHSKYIRAKHKVEKEKGFYTHLLIYIVVNLVITSVKMADDLDSWNRFYESFFSLNVLATWGIWGVFLILHYISFKYGPDWEERKIAQFMKEDLEQKNNKL